MMFKLKIKKNDTVMIISGKDKSKKGKVLQTMPKKRQIIVEGVNRHFRYTRPKRSGEKGQRVEFNSPFPVSRAMLVCGHCGKPTRVGRKLAGDKKLVRYCKKCKELIS